MAVRCFAITVLVIAAANWVFPQETSGPGFDSRPVEIPTVASTARRPLNPKDLVTLRDLHGLSISPNGKYVAFVVGQAIIDTNSYRSSLFVISTEPGSRPISLGSAGLPQWDPINQWVEEAPQWSPDSNTIFRRMRTSIVKTWQVWRWRVVGGSPVQVTHVDGNVREFQLTSDAQEVLVTVERSHDTAEIRKYAEAGVVYDGSFPLYRNRDVVNEALALIPHPTDTWLVDVHSSRERKPTGEEIRRLGPWESDIDEKVLNRFSMADNRLEGHHIIDAKISPDHQLVSYRLLPKDPSQSPAIYQLFVKTVRGGKPSEVQLPLDVYHIAAYWWSADSHTLFYVNAGAERKHPMVYAVAASGGAPHQIFSGTGFTWSWSVDQEARYLVCSRQTASEPSKIVLVDLRTESVRELADLNPEFRNITLSEPIRIEGINKFGDAWFAHIVKPLSYEPGKRYPAVLTTYRSGDYFLRGASGDESPIQIYAAHGLAVISFDFGRDPTFRIKERTFDKYLESEMSPIASMEMAIQKAAEMGIVDPQRVGITGYSRGTEQAARALVNTKLFRAASGVAGDDGPFFYYMSPNWIRQRRALWGLAGWPESEVREKWRQYAPELNADKINVPILNNDPDSEVMPDMALFTSLKELGKPVELIIYPNELHEINQPVHRYQIYQRNLDWFRFWLKNEEDPDPTKAEQYKRWRELRKLQEEDQKKASAPAK